MNQRQYLIEILLQAREMVTQVAQRASEALGGVTKAQEENTAASAKNAEASAHQARGLDDLHEAHTREKRDLDSVTKSMRGLGDETDKVGRKNRSVLEFFKDVSKGSKDADYNLSKLASNFRGFQVAFAIKYAQALVSVLVGLAGELAAVAASAIQAGAALGGAFAAASAQAIPVVGLLVAAFTRVAAVIKAVNLQNQQQLVHGREAQANAKRQAAAADQIRNAQRGVADAHRAVADAQDRVTQAQGRLNEARKQGVRQVEDLILAERNARLAAEGANLSYEQAQASLKRAIQSGDVSAISRAQLDVQGARVDRFSARRDATRARQDAIPVRRRGVEALDTVQSAREGVTQAHRGVADAKRQETRASEQLASARRDSAEAADTESAATDRLAEMLKQLTPAERGLYRSILRFQEIFRQNVRPITDIIIGAISRGVDAATKILQDSKLLGAFRNLATVIAGQMDRITALLSNRGNLSFFEEMAQEAARNIPKITSVFIDLYAVFKNIARAGVPAFRELLRFVGQLASEGRKASENTKEISKFFLEGIKYFEQWVRLGQAALGLILAITTAGGAKAGTDAIGLLTKRVQEATYWVNHNTEAVKKFFSDAAGITSEVGRVLLAIGKEVAHVFSPENVGAFADFLVKVLIPALSNTVFIMGKLTQLAHEFLSLPFVSDLAQWVVTVALVTKGITILSGAVRALGLMIGFVSAASVEGATAITIFGTASKVAFIGNPIVLAIVAAIAAIVLLDRKFHFILPTIKLLGKTFKDVGEFLKKVGQDILDWFSDVWTQGLLKWLRFPFEKFWEWIKPFWKNVFGFFGNVIGWFSDHFGSGSPWDDLQNAITSPFIAAFDIIKALFKVMKGAVSIFLDAIAGRFGSIGETIKGVWTDIFGTMYHVLAVVLNKIVGGVNTAIHALNKVNPFKDIPDIKFHMIENFEAAKYQAEGARRENTGRGRDVQPAAVGGEFQAKRGGRLALLAEGGYDEVVLTTDPKHRDRQMDLLARYLKKAGMAYAKGGYVQGAQPPSGPNSGAIRTILRGLFANGFNVTSGGEHRGTNTLHDQQAAVDFGDSVNNLKRLWSILYPARARFAELFGPTYLSPKPTLMNYGRGFSDPGLQAGHQDHIHLGILSGASEAARRLGSALGGNIGAVAQLPRILQRAASSLIGRNPLETGAGGAFRGGAAGVWELARKTIGALRSQARDALGASSGGTGTGTAAPPGQVRQWLTSALKLTNHFSARNLSLLYARTLQESGGNPKITNNWDSNARAGHPSKGLLQTIDSTFNAYKLRGHGDIWNPIDNAIAAIRYMFSKYGGIVGATGKGYAFGGAVPGRGATPIMAHGGEHVWTSKEVERAGGHGAMFALRRMAGGGTQSRTGGYLDGGAVKFDLRGPHAKAPRISEVVQIFGELADAFDHLDMRKVKGLSGRLRRAFDSVLGDGGVLDRLNDAVGNIATRGALRFQRRQFGPNAAGVLTRRPLTGVQLANLGLRTTRETGEGLETEARGIDDARDTARAAIRAARKRLNDAKKGTKAYKKAQDQLELAQGALASVRQREADLAAAQAQNVQDQIEALEAVQQARVDVINETASGELAQQDRATRLAGLGGANNFGLIGAILASRGGTLQRQRDSLAGQVGAAQASGNIALVKTLNDSIADLDVSIQENSQAIKDNTDAAFAQRVADVNSKFGFTSGILSAATSFYQSLGALTGQDTTGSVKPLLQGQGAALGDQRGGLVGALADLLGATPGDKTNLLGLSGEGLVKEIMRLTSGSTLQNIQGYLDPAQQTQFQDLVNAILTNVTATTDNTKALQDLVGQADTASYSSSFWSAYRYAIFTGAGQVLPSYASTAPRAHNGMAIARDGLYNLQAGETIVPVRESGQLQTGTQIGEQHDHFHITTPKEVVDGVTLSRETAWARRMSPSGSSS